MFEIAVDVVKTAAVALAILLPAIAAIAQYRREERKPPPSIGAAGMVAIGGAFAERHQTEAYIERADQLVAAIRMLADAVMRQNEALRERERNLAEMVHELTEMRRALTDISASKRVIP